MFGKHTRIKGFTLIELMLVMVITGILILIGITTFQSSQVKSRDLRRKSDLKQVTTALELYYNDKGIYPKSTTGKIYGCGADDKSLCDWKQPFKDSKNTVYIESIPQDSASGRTYYYWSNYSSFQLYARLENNDDGDIVKNIAGDPSEYSGTICTTGTPVACNYGVSSSNTTPDVGHSPG